MDCWVQHYLLRDIQLILDSLRRELRLIQFSKWRVGFELVYFVVGAPRHGWGRLVVGLGWGVEGLGLGVDVFLHWILFLMVRYRFWWRLRLFIWNRFLFLKIGWELSLRKVNWCLIGVRRKVFSINLSLRRFFLSAFEATSTGRVWSTLNSFIGSINWTVYSVYSTRWVANKLRILLYGISISVLWYVADARVWIVLLRCSLLDWALRDQHALHVLGATVPF